MQLKFHPSITSTFLLTSLAMPYLTSSAPTNRTSPTTNPILAVSPIDLAADQCPTPPTEFLPYSPPPGYSPSPGCAPASQGTQPSQGNPPAGYYGGSGSDSGSGSSSQTTSSARSLKGMNPIAKILGCFLPSRKTRRGVIPQSEEITISMTNLEEMDWVFDGMQMFGGAAGEHRA